MHLTYLLSFILIFKYNSLYNYTSKYYTTIQHTQIHSMKASSRYLGLKGKHFQGYQNDFEAESISGCGAPWPRIDNAGVNAGLSQISRSRVR